MSHNILDSLTMSNPIESPINMAFEHCSTGDIGYLLAIVHPGGKPMDSWIAENPLNVLYLWSVVCWRVNTIVFTNENGRHGETVYRCRCLKHISMVYWLVVLTILKNMKVNGKIIPYLWKIKHV